MRDFSKVSPAVWQSARFNDLPSDDGRYLYLYLLTCQHQTSAGCYRLPDGYACADLRWSPDRLAKARQQLIAADLILFDAECSVVMITRWFKHNPPMNESHLIGIERVIERLPSEMICDAALQALEESWEAIESVKLAKAQLRQKAAHGSLNSPGGPIPGRLQTPYLRGQ